MQKAIKKIDYASHFVRSYKKLSNIERVIARKKEKIFRVNCFDPILRIHKLKGKLRDRWSFSLTPRLRVMFVFINDNQVLFLDVGDHKVYK